MFSETLEVRDRGRYSDFSVRFPGVVPGRAGKPKIQAIDGRAERSAAW